MITFFFLPLAFAFAQLDAPARNAEKNSRNSENFGKIRENSRNSSINKGWRKGALGFPGTEKRSTISVYFIGEPGDRLAINSENRWIGD